MILWTIVAHQVRKESTEEYFFFLYPRLLNDIRARHCSYRSILISRRLIVVHRVKSLLPTPRANFWMRSAARQVLLIRRCFILAKSSSPRPCPSIGIVIPLDLLFAAVFGVRASSGGSLAPETARFLAVASKLRRHNIVISDRFLDHRAFRSTFFARQLSQAK